MLQKYLDLGWVTVPTQRDNPRAPTGKDWQLRTTAVTEYKKYSHGAYLVCGRASGVSVIDLDGTRWFDRFSELTDDPKHKTPVAATPSGGAHILVRHSEADWWNNAVKIAPEIDLRTEGGGIALPMRDGEKRYWLKGGEPWEVPLADPRPYEDLIQQIVEETRSEKRRPENATKSGRSNLAQLLARPPTEGSRNSWLAQVAGHLAPGIDYEDGWLQLVRVINAGMDDPLSEQELVTTVGKIWARDRAKTPQGTPHGLPVEVDAEGNLGVWRGDGQKRTLELWLKPCPKIVGAYRSTSAYWWKLASGDQEITLRTGDIHNTQRLSGVLGNIGVLLYPAAVGREPNGSQFQAWLKWASPEPIVQHPWWGWSDELQTWVGLDEQAIGPDGAKPWIGEVDRPDIVERIPTWHADTTAAVFCAWVALQAAKGKADLQFEPNVVLQGAAGSGKTRGLFSFASRLTGTERAAISTMPSLRDKITGQRSGIVVIDDMTDVDHRILELYRLSTSAETMVRKVQTGSGWVDEQAQLVGSIVISGEVLEAMSTDRALRDRSVILQVPQAAKTRSLLDPKRPQWDDIQAVFAELGGTDEATAHHLAGPFIRRILAAVDEVPMPNGPSDRISIKLDLIRYGAALWQTAYPGSRTYSGRTVVEAAEDWCLEQSAIGDWRNLTLVSRILAETADSAAGAFHAVRFDDDGSLLVHPERLSRYWQREHRDPRNQELGAESNIRRELEELKAAGLCQSRQNRRMAGKSVKVWVLEPVVGGYIADLAGVVIDGPDGQLSLTDGEE